MMATNTQNICILLATFNGGKYIREQIESVQRQSATDWLLLARDDGSTDETLEILEKLAADDPRISLLDNCGQFARGATRNFGHLMKAGLETQSNIFFLCDQDDTWHSRKIEIQSSYFPQGGREKSSILVHSDLAVVDDTLRQLHPSFVRHMALEPEPRKPLNYLLTRNYVTGCANACNRRLLEEALPISDGAIMHDWWLAATAAATGSIRYIDRSLVKYRQHESNVIGAKGFWHGLNPTNNWIKGWKAGNAEFLETFDQIEALNEHAQDKAVWPEESKDILEKYSKLLTLPILKRIQSARALGLRQGNILLQLIYYLRLLTVNRR